MPIRRLKLTKSEAAEYRTQLLQLKEMGVLVGYAGESNHEPDPLTVEQVDHELGKLYELPWGEIAIVVFAELTVLRSGDLITGREMRTSWDDVLELNDPKECSYYDDLICGWPEFPPQFLNHWLTQSVPLRPRQVEGAIFATGPGSVPPECHDHLPVAVELFLRGHRCNELRFDFRVRVDRSLKLKYGLQPRKRLEAARSRKPLFPFKGDDGQPGGQTSVSPEQCVVKPYKLPVKFPNRDEDENL